MFIAISAVMIGLLFMTMNARGLNVLHATVIAG